MTNLRTLPIALLLTTALGCRDHDASRRAAESADAVADRDRALDRSEGERARSSAEVARAAAELANADVVFATRRRDAIAGYRRELAVFGTQAVIARGMLSDDRMTRADHAAADGAVVTFERELSNAADAVDLLAVTSPSGWDLAADNTASELDHLRDARDLAFRALSVKRTLVSQVPGA